MTQMIIEESEYKQLKRKANNSNIKNKSEEELLDFLMKFTAKLLMAMSPSTAHHIMTEAKRDGYEIGVITDHSKFDKHQLVVTKL